MRRPDIDVQLRDEEGLTLFGLYNLTVGAPSDSDPLKIPGVVADLYMWGGNSYVSISFALRLKERLGHGDSKDGACPDMLTLERNANADTGTSVKP